MGSWSGTLVVAGQELTVDPATTWGSRDRSWGVRPIGESEPKGIYRDTTRPGGMWSYFPMRFEDHSIFYICSEGRRRQPQPRAGRAGVARRPRRAAGPHRARPPLLEPRCPRLLDHSTISFPDAGIEIEAESLIPNYIALGTGYGLEPDVWHHGMYHGPETVVQGKIYEVPEIATIGAYAVVDHAARFTYDGHTGYGLYEHAFSGAMPKYGLE